MKREELRELGLSDEQIEKVFAMHGKELNDLKTKNETLVTENEGYKNRMTEYDNQLKNLETFSKDNESLKSELEKIKGENAQAIENLKLESAERIKNMAIDNYLTSKGAKNVKAVRAAMLDGDKLSKVNLKDDGSLDGMEEIFNSSYEGNEYLFNVTDASKIGVGGQGGKASKTESDMFDDFTNIR